MYAVRTCAKYIVNLYRLILDIVAPPFCARCHIWLLQEKVFCDACIVSIKPIVSKSISVTSRYDVPVVAISGYIDPLKSLILAKNSVNPVASRQLGALMWDHTTFKHMPCDVLVPVPLHWTRYAWRGYNQAHEIAQELGARSGKPVINVVRRVQKTAYQSLVPFASRHENVKDVFALTVTDRDSYRGKHLVIVDDLMTSGATISMVAKQLSLLHPASISAVVACRVT